MKKVTTLSLVLCSAMIMNTAQPVNAQSAPESAPNSDSYNNRSMDNNDNHYYGLIGLVGLLGLAGLIRKPKDNEGVYKSNANTPNR